MVPFACMPSPIPRQDRWKLVRSYDLDRLLHQRFRGLLSLLSVHSRYGLPACRVAFATFCTRGFSSLVASPAALIATGWSEPVPGRVTPAVDHRLSRRTGFATRRRDDQRSKTILVAT